MKRKAKKKHQCTLCHGEINPGEEYEYARVTPWDHIDNEYFFDYKAHPPCDEYWQKNGDVVDYILPDSWDEFKKIAESEREWEEYRRQLRRKREELKLQHTE